MRIAIMQPYLFPYIGYFQLINAVDTFVIYDNIEYTKKGWINRNRILSNTEAAYITLPLKKHSDFALIQEIQLADNHEKKMIKILNKIEDSYRKAPYFTKVFPILKTILLNKELNLFKYLRFSLGAILSYLEIDTKIIVSSQIDIDHNLKAQEKVLTICEKLQAKIYINPIGGLNLYSKKDFSDKIIELSFLQSDEIVYNQFVDDFISSLSIIDVMMFNSKYKIKKYLNNYTLK